MPAQHYCNIASRCKPKLSSDMQWVHDDAVVSHATFIERFEPQGNVWRVLSNDSRHTAAQHQQ